MRLLILITLVVSTISFDPTTDIELKFGGYCDHFLTIDECSDPATLTAVLARSDLQRTSWDNPYTYDPYNKLQYYFLKKRDINNINREGQNGFLIDDNSILYHPGCYAEREDSFNGYNYWCISWRKFYDSFTLPHFYARRDYIKSQINDTSTKRIYVASACHFDKPCICRKSGGLSAPDRSLPGTYYSKYESGGGGTPGPAGPQGPVGSDTTLELWIVGGIAILATILGAIALIMKGPVGPVGTDIEKKALLTQVRVDRQLNKIDF